LKKDISSFVKLGFATLASRIVKSSIVVERTLSILLCSFDSSGTNTLVGFRFFDSLGTDKFVFLRPIDIGGTNATSLLQNIQLENNLFIY
jgi:hypothetical protein